jgi:hypothetical protein
MVLHMKGKTTDCGSLENRVLQTIFLHKGKNITSDWRKQHNKVLHNSYPSLHIITMITWRRMRWESCNTHRKE